MMIYTIRNALPAAQLDRIETLASKVEFVDGRKTASGVTAGAKRNQQAHNDDPALEDIRKIVVNGLMRNNAFTSASLPLRMVAPMLSRYEPGMRYEDHIDLPIMAGNPPVRTDLALTLFVSSKDSYDGGELVISSDQGARKVKLDRGGLMLYPATTTHRVEPVTRGTRLAVVSWVQSLVRQSEQRALLMELARIETPTSKEASDTQTAMRLGRVRATLMRMWAEA